MKFFPITVIDDFFDDPAAVKNFAESIEYDTPNETNYPGVTSKKQITEKNITNNFQLISL